MRKKNYNKKRHLELLKQKSMGINLEEYSSELGQYSCMLEAHLDWLGRERYLKLLEDFQKGKIQDFEFCFFFEEKGLGISDIANILESNLILLSSQYNHFSSLVSYIIDICKCYIEEADDRDEDSRDFSELVDQLNWEIKDQYFELIEGFLDESRNFLNFKKRYESLVKVAKELESNSIFL